MKRFSAALLLLSICCFGFSGTSSALSIGSLNPFRTAPCDKVSSLKYQACVASHKSSYKLCTDTGVYVATFRSCPKPTPEHSPSSNPTSGPTSTPTPSGSTPAPTTTTATTQTDPTGTAGTLKSDACSGLNQLDTTNSCGGGDAPVSSVAANVVSVISYAVGIIAIIMVIVAGFRYITSGGDANKVGAAKTSLIYAIVGIVIVALAQFLVHYVLSQTSS